MSPFRSKRQARWMFAAEARGELPKGTAERWAEETPDIKRLPEKAGGNKGTERSEASETRKGGKHGEGKGAKAGGGGRKGVRKSKGKVKAGRR